jgi:7,8-dihydropterin-6-yl-methyl-4-(beta-D-ribofuranosyl)aminobenzene 5'-phosphate synthase
MDITVLIENSTGASASDRLAAEHGLSLHVDTGRTRILFDTGTTGAFADNAHALGIDLARIDFAVVSHHHYDHGGGLERLFQENRTVRVWMKPGPDGRCVATNPDGSTHPIGIDPEVMQSHADRLVSIADPAEIAPGVTILTRFPRNHPLPVGNGRLFVESADGRTADPFDHELAMVIDDGSGITVITGCAHRGVLNIVDAAMQAFPERSVRAVIGGFHLNAETEESIRVTADLLAERDVRHVWTGHCTGERAEAILAERLGPDCFAPLRSGARLTL